MAEGIRPRHSRACASLPDNGGGRCNCKPSYEAHIFLKHEGRKLRKTFPTQAAARSWRVDALRDAGRGQLRTPTKLTVAAAASELLAGMADGTVPTRAGGRYKPSVIRSYDSALRITLLPELGDVRLSELRRADVQDLADRLTADGRSASSVQNTLDPLRVIYRRAIRRDLLAVDPTKGLELRRPDGRRERIAAPDEARALLDALPDEDQALWATALFAGLRRGELQALRWTDIDLDGRVIRVERGWDAKEGEQAAKSKAATRKVPIIARLAPILAAHKLATGRDGDQLVLGITGEEPFAPSTVRRRALVAWGWKQATSRERTGPRTVWVRLREDALDPIGLHEARHTCASLMIASGANAKALSKIMGHASISVTFDVYGHLMPGGEDEVRERVDSYLDRLDGGPHLRAVGK